MGKLGKFLIFFFCFWIVVCFTVVAVALTSLIPEHSLTAKSQLGIVVIQGELMDGSPVVEELRALRDDKGVVGIVLRVESPGGTVAAAQEINSALAELRADSFPVVATYGNMAASGGYYASLPAEKIFANPGTLTGSIGVITSYMHGEKLMEKIGIQSETITSGKLKDAGNPYRAANPEDLAYFKEVVDDTYEQFLGSVAKWRKIPADSLRPIADGRVFTGRMAKERGLVDTLGTQQDAVRWLSKRCGLEEVPATLETAAPPEPFLRSLMSGVESLVPARMRSEARVLWMVP